MRNAICLCMLAMFAIAGCAVGTPDTGVSEQSMTSRAGQGADVTPPNFRWMVGVWDCTGGYHAVPPFVVRKEAAVYTFATDANGVVHGAYAPTQVDNSPNTGSSTESLVIGATDTLIAPATISFLRDDSLFSASASGVDIIFDETSTILGFTQLDGTISFAGKPDMVWNTTMFGIKGTDSRPTHFTINSRFGNDFELHQYFDSICILRQ